jgi:hypothetical protein
MLSRILKSSSLMWCLESLFGFNAANLLNGGGYAGCLLGINGKIAFQSWLATGEAVDNPNADAEIFAIDPDGAGLRRGIHIAEPSERRSPGLAEAKP